MAESLVLSAVLFEPSFLGVCLTTLYSARNSELLSVKVNVPADLQYYTRCPSARTPCDRRVS